MRLRCGVDGNAASSAVLIESLRIQQDSTQAISTCELTLFQAYGMSRYDVALYNRAAFVYEWTVEEWSEIVIWDEDTGTIHFAGFVQTIDVEIDGPHLKRTVTAVDWGILLDRAIVSHTWPDGTADSDIVRDLIATVPELKAGQIVMQAAQLGELEAKDMRVRDALDVICDLTGGEWHVSYDGFVNYYHIGSIVPPFALSDQPNGTTKIAFALEDYKLEFAEGANRIKVLGALTDTGEISVLVQDGSSQQRFGVLSMTIVDRNILDEATARLWGQTEIARRAWPSANVTASIYRQGLARGQSVNIESIRYGVSGTFVLRSLTIVIAAPDRTRKPYLGEAGHVLKYTGSFGFREPDLVYTLRRMQRRAPEKTKAPAANILPGTIKGEDLASGIGVIYQVPAEPTDWSQYPADAVFFNTTDRKLYRRIPGNTWTAVVPTADLEGQVDSIKILKPGSVTDVILADGSVVTAKIPDGAINAPKIAASAIEANAIAANAILALHINSDAITSRHILAGEVVAGKIGALAVVAGNVAADAITAGTIAAAAVKAGNIAADAVTAGNIAAGAIRAEDAVFEAAAIKDADIANLSGKKITANSITSEQLDATEIAVGAGGKKPGRIGVYSSATTLVAALGDLAIAGAAGFYGIWAKVASFGGNGYSDAPIYTDLAGNLFLRNTNFEVSSGSQKVTIKNNTFDPTYTSIGVKVADGTNTAWYVSRGVAVYKDGNNNAIAACVTHPVDTSAGQVYCFKVGGVSTLCKMDGQLGRITAESGYYVGGGKQVINDAGEFVGAMKLAEYRVTSGNTLVINTGGVFVGSGVSTPGHDIAAKQYYVGSTLVVNTNGAFVGAGVATPNNGHSAAGFNPYVGGLQYNGVGTGSFTSADGKTVQVRGGVITSIT